MVQSPRTTEDRWHPNQLWSTYRNQEERCGPLTVPQCTRLKNSDKTSQKPNSSCGCGCSSCALTIEQLKHKNEELTKIVEEMNTRLADLEKKSFEKSPRFARSRARRSSTPIGAVTPVQRDSSRANRRTDNRISSSEDHSTSLSSPLRTFTDSSQTSGQSASESTPRAVTLSNRRELLIRNLQRQQQSTAVDTSTSIEMRSEPRISNQRTQDQRRSLRRSVAPTTTVPDLNQTPTSSRHSQRPTILHDRLDDTPEGVRRVERPSNERPPGSVIRRHESNPHVHPQSAPQLRRPRYSTLASRSTAPSIRSVERPSASTSQGSLMAHLLQRRPQFVQGLLERQRRLKEAARRRSQIHEEKMQVAALLAEDLIDVEVALPVLRQDPTEVYAFSLSSARRRTKNKYRSTAEYNTKVQKEEKRVERAATRIIAHVFSEETRRKRRTRLSQDAS